MGSLVAIYLPTAAALRDVSGQERGLTSAIRVHVIMERPRRERARAVLEVVGNHPDLDAVDSRKLREHLASDLRARLGDRFDQATRGIIVGAFVLPAPGIVGLADDVEVRVTGLAGEFTATAERARQLGMRSRRGRQCSGVRWGTRTRWYGEAMRAAHRDHPARCRYATP